MNAGLMHSTFVFENHHIVALNIYYSIYTTYIYIYIYYTRVRLYRDIPETHQRKAEGKRYVFAHVDAV